MCDGECVLSGREGCNRCQREAYMRHLHGMTHHKCSLLAAPTSASCESEMSTRVLAAGWTMSNSFMIVAPSLEMVVLPVGDSLMNIHKCRLAGSPWPSTISLSMPRGPRVEEIASTTISHAFMLLIIWGFPWEVSVPSFKRMTGACCRGMKTYCGVMLDSWYQPSDNTPH